MLHLDHINGSPKDNRIENLQFLCPNCHSQTKSYAGKKNKIFHYCKLCGNVKETKQSKFCRLCSGIKRRKIHDRPSKENLEKMILTMSWSDIGKKYSVSDNAIRKWAKIYGIVWKKRSDLHL